MASPLQCESPFPAIQQKVHQMALVVPKLSQGNCQLALANCLSVCLFSEIAKGRLVNDGLLSSVERKATAKWLQWPHDHEGLLDMVRVHTEWHMTSFSQKWTSFLSFGASVAAGRRLHRLQLALHLLLPNFDHLSPYHTETFLIYHQSKWKSDFSCASSSYLTAVRARVFGIGKQLHWNDYHWHVRH